MSLPLGLICNTRRPSQRKRACYHFWLFMEERQPDEHKFQSIFEQLIAGVVLVSLDGHYLDANPAFCAMFGYSKEEILQMDFFALTHPDDVQLSQRVMHEVVERRDKGVRFSKRYLRKDGRILWADVHSALVLSNAGEPSHFITTLVDTSDRVAAEAALLAEKERLAVTLRSIGDGVISTDTQGRVVLMNAVAEHLTGWRHEEAVGRPLAEVFQIFDEGTREARRNPVDKVLEAGEVVTLANHTVLLARTGAERAISDSGAPIRNQNGEVVGVVLVFRDSTEKRRAEENLSKIERLESLGVLAGGIAHDFNNLLGGVFGYVELAREHLRSGDTAEAEEELSGALTVFEQARGLSQQLLTFAKGGAPTKRPGDLRRLLLESTKFALSGSAVRPTFTLAHDLWTCHYDESRIAQVVHNLVINAVQAMPSGGTLTVTAENVWLPVDRFRHLAPGRYLRIGIHDEGHGIPREHLNKVFDPFFTTKQKGSGLGLATCWSIIQRHDGHMEVESELGKGTTFLIYLPATVGDTDKRSGEYLNPLKGSGRILLMDDELYQRDLVKRALSAVGYAVTTAHDGAAAVAAFEQAQGEGSPFDILILDLTVPGGMGGKEAIQRIHAIDPKARAIVASGYSEDPVLAEPRKHGFVASLQKPFHMNALCTLLAQLLHASEEASEEA
jgi:PAS domain S-box-containing protein